MLPYFGPGWYGRDAVVFLLDTGIANWSDVCLAFNASARRPSKYVGKGLQALEALWLEVGASLEESPSWSNGAVMTHDQRCWPNTAPCRFLGSGPAGSA